MKNAVSTILNRSLIIWSILTVFMAAGAEGQEAVPPHSVKVLPVFFIPKGEPAPTNDQAERLMKHLVWSQTRYRELLRNQDSFAIAEDGLRIYQSARPLAFYREQPEGSAPQVVSELLAELKCTRYNCPYILLAVMMNPNDYFPVGGGRPLNGGLNTGGGIVILSSFALDGPPNFQSTLQHELGHSFGLPHVDAYGYDMASNDSLMSYNLRHHTNHFTASQTQGILIAEDLRALALNKRVFSKFRFDPGTDVPPGYSIAARIETIPPMKIPGQPDGLKISTESGEEYGSKISNLLQGFIGPNKKDGTVTYDAATMWHSAKTKDGWASVQLTFPYDVELSRIVIHSQHSGEYHIAEAVRLAVRNKAGWFCRIIEADLKSADDAVMFTQTKGRVWRMELRAGESRYIVLRGLQFFSGSEELFPPQLPCPF
ncbi:MAG: hypothetical protein PHW04_11405 [Candidatus Wallbacteria bacterium]|nr:hypothetical protein [Candidatus Wallbacteria bacterium]